jgi:hypothetical protein
VKGEILVEAHSLRFSIGEITFTANPHRFLLVTRDNSRSQQGNIRPQRVAQPVAVGKLPRQYFRRRIISARIKSRVASTSATTSQGQNNSLLTVLVVVTPDFHKLICRKFLEFAGMGVAILPHEVCCFFQVEPFAVNLIRLGRHLCDNSEKRKQD